MAVVGQLATKVPRRAARSSRLGECTPSVVKKCRRATEPPGDENWPQSPPGSRGPVEGRPRRPTVESGLCRGCRQSFSRGLGFADTCRRPNPGGDVPGPIEAHQTATEALGKGAATACDDPAVERCGLVGIASLTVEPGQRLDRMKRIGGRDGQGRVEQACGVGRCRLHGQQLGLDQGAIDLEIGLVRTTSRGQMALRGPDAGPIARTGSSLSNQRPDAEPLRRQDRRDAIPRLNQPHEASDLVPRGVTVAHRIEIGQMAGRLE